MFNSHFNNFTLGYCTNVHAGTGLAQIQENLANVSTQAACQLGGSDTHLGIGLWIPHRAAEELQKESECDSFREFLSRQNLFAYTVNGFPYDNFHQEVVKQKVYVPGWWSDTRHAYTKQLANSLARLLPEDQTLGSISTLPLGWPNNEFDSFSSREQSELHDAAGQRFRALAKELQQLERDSGRRIVVAIEPEPGCCLDTTEDIVNFFDTQLKDAVDRKYITVCHDICHSAVMMESQTQVLRRYADQGIKIGKIQVSSAIVVDWQKIKTADHASALNQLRDFAEDRYLHQTGRVQADGEFALANDLPELLNCESVDDQLWAIHFHVPIFLEKIGLLGTTRDDVVECLRTIIESGVSSESSIDFTGHLEVETYAWTVLPQEMRKRGLAQDIASELQWLYDSLTEIKSQTV